VSGRIFFYAAPVLLAFPAVQAAAQTMAMPPMAMPPAAAPSSPPASPSSAGGASLAGGSMGGMIGDLGPYPMTRDASGTAWQPDSAPMEGLHADLGGWATMLHGYGTLVYDDQGGGRGADKTVFESMLMGMAQHPYGGGTFTVRAMTSLDPLMGKTGYPELLQTGETADGRTELVDRQLWGR
jgi:hypothetical protein